VVWILFLEKSMDSLEIGQDRKRLQTALLLSVLAYFTWLSFMGTNPPQNQNPSTITPIPELSEQYSDEKNKEDSPEVPKSVPQVLSSIEPHSKSLDKEGVTIDIHSDGGGIREIVLTQYTELPDKNSWWGWILDGMDKGWSPYGGGDSVLSILSEQGLAMVAGTDNAIIVPNTVQKNEDGSVISTQSSDSVEIVKTIKPLDKPYLFQIDFSFTNKGSTRLERLWVGIFDEMLGDGGRFLDDMRPQFNIDGSIETILDVGDLDKEPEIFEDPTSWFGLGSRYFLVAAQPSNASISSSEAVRLDENRYGSLAYLSQPLDIGATREVSFILYAGPKQLDILQSLDAGEGEPKISGGEWAKAVEFGIFGFFSRILLFLLKMFFAGFKNWGVSILLLTLLVKVIFFPLTQKAFESGRKMQLLQPQLKEIKEKYKDNQQLQSQETLKVFQENGASPLGGCLPTVIQIPVWFALYNVMLYSVELYDSSFLYLKDLTSMDPYGILPITYAVLMLFQQRMMPMANMDPMQQKMFKIMPVAFAAFMFTFPSGLVLYFSFNIFLTICQQWLIKMKFDDQSVALASQ
jgi:YidC/Oxa1 family membrane protein insertase